MTPTKQKKFLYGKLVYGKLRVLAKQRYELNRYKENLIR